MKKRKLDVYDMIIIISLSVGLTTGGTVFASNQIAKSKFNEINTQLIEKNMFDTPAVLPVKNGVVNLNILNCFTDNQLQEIKAGIEKLDFDAKGLEFNVSFSQADAKKSINIKSYDSITDYYQINNTYAHVDLMISSFSSRILYPINLYVNTKKIEEYGADYNTIIRHELMHCLGFTDLQDYNKYKDYVMFYTYLGHSKELSSEEYEVLNSIYSPEKTGLVKVQKPSDIIYNYSKDNINDDLENENEKVF